jgi:putative sterol carrier protein
MKQKAFSNEWAQLYKEKINSNNEFKNLATSWSDSLILETSEEKEKVGVLLVLKNGECTLAKIADQNDYDNTNYVINAKIDVWRNLLEGKVDPVMAIMQKKLILVKGSLTNLLKYVNAAKELLKTAKQIETYF